MIQRRLVSPESRNPSDDDVNITPSSNKKTPKQVCSKTKAGLALCAFVGATFLLSLMYPYWYPANNLSALGRSYQNLTKEVEERPNPAKITSESNIAFPPGCNWECYLERNPNLIKIGGIRTEKGALHHYVNNGAKEDRDCSCQRYYCCGLHNFNNAGHALTENVADLYHCGPVVRFNHPDGFSQDPVYSKFLQIAKLFKTRVAVTRTECKTFYHANPSAHPSGARLAAYSLMGRQIGSGYDAFLAASALREAQERLLLSCGINPPKFNEIYSNKTQYEQLTLRQPSKSVILIVRHPMRKFLNANQTLSMCQEMKLSCSIFDANDFFKQAQSDDFCFVLKQFQDSNPLIIGVQGAELIYPLLLSLRLFLLVDLKVSNSTAPIEDRRRFGNMTKPGEIQAATNLIMNTQEVKFDRYFPEFSAIFGADLTPIHSAVDYRSLEVARKSKKSQCKKTSFCADRTADLDDVRIKLEQLIQDGNLLQNI